MAIYVDEVMLREPNLLVPGGKPTGPVKLDPSHSICRDLDMYFFASPNHATFHKKINIIERPVNEGGTPVYTAVGNDIGYGDKTSIGTRSLYSPSNVTDVSTGNFTIAGKIYLHENPALLGYLVAVETYDPGIAQTSNSKAYGYLHTAYYTETFSFPVILNIALRRRGSNTIELLVDGAVVGSGSNANACSGTQFCIGASNTSGGWRMRKAIIFWGGYWTRALKDIELVQLTNDPYQIVIPA